MSNSARFEFGENWRRFLASVDERRIEAAKRSLREMLGEESLAGKSFLDVGCGSGLFSLAARQLGASVRSFDLDDQSVACANELKRRFCPNDPDWCVEKGSAADPDYLAALGKFDIVYCWGVLHHTGDLWGALEGVCGIVRDGGRLCLAIYNDQGYVSQGWRLIKQAYHRLPRILRPCLVLAVAAWLATARLATTLVAVALRLVTLRNPWVPIGNWMAEVRQARSRGMHWWRDLVDWVGGYPFEVARPEAVFNFCRDRGFSLAYLTTQGGGHGCNEFVFVKRGGLGR